MITIKSGLLVASVDRAKGINWSESDPTLTTPQEEKVEFGAELEREPDDDLAARVERLERLLETGDREGGNGETATRETSRARARRAWRSRGGNAQKQ